MMKQSQKYLQFYQITYKFKKNKQIQMLTINSELESHEDAENNNQKKIIRPSIKLKRNLINQNSHDDLKYFSKQDEENKLMSLSIQARDALIKMQRFDRYIYAQESEKNLKVPIEIQLRRLQKIKNGNKAMRNTFYDNQLTITCLYNHIKTVYELNREINTIPILIAQKESLQKKIIQINVQNKKDLKQMSNFKNKNNSAAENPLLKIYENQINENSKFLEFISFTLKEPEYQKCIKLLENEINKCLNQPQRKQVVVAILEYLIKFNNANNGKFHSKKDDIIKANLRRIFLEENDLDFNITNLENLIKQFKSKCKSTQHQQSQFCELQQKEQIVKDDDNDDDTEKYQTLLIITNHLKLIYNEIKNKVETQTLLNLELDQLRKECQHLKNKIQSTKATVSMHLQKQKDKILLQNFQKEIAYLKKELQSQKLVKLVELQNSNNSNNNNGKITLTTEQTTLISQWEIKLQKMLENIEKPINEWGIEFNKEKKLLNSTQKKTITNKQSNNSSVTTKFSNIIINVVSILDHFVKKQKEYQKGQQQQKKLQKTIKLLKQNEDKLLKSKSIIQEDVKKLKQDLEQSIKKQKSTISNLKDLEKNYRFLQEKLSKEKERSKLLEQDIERLQKSIKNVQQMKKFYKKEKDRNTVKNINITYEDQSVTISKLEQELKILKQQIKNKRSQGKDLISSSQNFSEISQSGLMEQKIQFIEIEMDQLKKICMIIQQYLSKSLNHKQQSLNLRQNQQFPSTYQFKNIILEQVSKTIYKLFKKVIAQEEQSSRNVFYDKKQQILTIHDLSISLNNLVNKMKQSKDFNLGELNKIKNMIELMNNKTNTSKNQNPTITNSSNFGEILWKILQQYSKTQIKCIQLVQYYANSYVSLTSQYQNMQSMVKECETNHLSQQQHVKLKFRINQLQNLMNGLQSELLKSSNSIISIEQISKLNSDLSSENIQLKGYLKQLEQNIQILQKEIFNFKEYVTSLEKNIEITNQQKNVLVVKIQSQKNKKNSQLKIQQNKIKLLNDDVNQLKHQIQILREQNSRILAQNEKCYYEYKIINNDITKLHHENLAIKNENENLLKDFLSIKGQNTRFRELETENIQNLQNQNNKLSQLVNSLKNENKELKQQMEVLEKHHSKLNEENLGTKNLNEKVKEEVSTLFQQKQVLLTKIKYYEKKQQQNNATYQNLLNRINEFSVKLQKTEIQNINLNQLNGNLQNQTKQVIAKITKLQQENSQLKLKLQNLQTHSKITENAKLISQTQEIQNLRIHILKIQQQILALKNQKNILYLQMQLTKNENIKLHQQTQVMKRQNQKLKLTNHNMENEIRRISEILQILNKNKQQQTIKILQQLDNIKKQNQQLKEYNVSINDQKIKSQQENQYIIMDINKIHQQYNNLRQEYQNYIKQTQIHITHQKQKINQDYQKLQNNYAKALEQFQRQRSKFKNIQILSSTKQQEIRSLKSQIIKQRQQFQSMNPIKNQIQLLRIQNFKLQEEIDHRKKQYNGLKNQMIQQQETHNLKQQQFFIKENELSKKIINLQVKIQQQFLFNNNSNVIQEQIKQENKKLRENLEHYTKVIYELQDQQKNNLQIFKIYEQELINNRNKIQSLQSTIENKMTLLEHEKQEKQKLQVENHKIMELKEKLEQQILILNKQNKQIYEIHVVNKQEQYELQIQELQQNKQKMQKDIVDLHKQHQNEIVVLTDENTKLKLNLNKLIQELTYKTEKQQQKQEQIAIHQQTKRKYKILELECSRLESNIKKQIQMYNLFKEESGNMINLLTKEKKQLEIKYLAQKKANNQLVITNQKIESKLKQSLRTNTSLIIPNPTVGPINTINTDKIHLINQINNLNQIINLKNRELQTMSQQLSQFKNVKQIQSNLVSLKSSHQDTSCNLNQTITNNNIQEQQKRNQMSMSLQNPISSKVKRMRQITLVSGKKPPVEYLNTNNNLNKQNKHINVSNIIYEDQQHPSYKKLENEFAVLKKENDNEKLLIQRLSNQINEFIKPDYQTPSKQLHLSQDDNYQSQDLQSKYKTKIEGQKFKREINSLESSSYQFKHRFNSIEKSNQNNQLSNTKSSQLKNFLQKNILLKQQIQKKENQINQLPQKIIYYYNQSIIQTLNGLIDRVVDYLQKSEYLISEKKYNLKSYKNPQFKNESTNISLYFKHFQEYLKALFTKILESKNEILVKQANQLIELKHQMSDIVNKHIEQFQEEEKKSSIVTKQMGSIRSNNINKQLQKSVYFSDQKINFTTQSSKKGSLIALNHLFKMYLKGPHPQILYQIHEILNSTNFAQLESRHL